VFFHVRDLELKPVRFDVELPPGTIEFLDPKLKQSGPLHAVGQAELVMGSLGEIRVTGHVKVRLQTECDRCLEPSDFPVDSSFELYYRPVVESYLGANASKAPRAVRVEEKAIDAGEAEMGFYEGEGLELNDVLREFVLLALPMQRLCSENCKGICPECGQDRNKNECSCRTSAGDNRWAALKELRK
jgi:uncharacterized protein